jgi:hypothetical protein
MKLALELSRSAVQDKAGRLSDLRTRAGTLLAAASISGSLLGVTHGTLDTVSVLPLIAYEGAVGWLEVTRGENAGVVDDLTRWYVAAAIALGVEVVLGIVALPS